MSDADLYTGVQPSDAGVFGNEAEPKELKEEREQAIAQAVKLLPSVEVIREIINARRASVRDFDSYFAAVGDDADDNKLKDEYRARQLHLEFLSQLEGEIENRLANFEERTS